MSNRYGGKFSPKGTPDNARKGIQGIQMPKARKTYGPRLGIRSRLLFIAPLPLFIAGLFELTGGDAFGALTELGAFAILILAAWMLREGMIAEFAYNERNVSRPPALPRKMIASVLTGIGVGVAAWFGWEQDMINAIALGALAGLAHVATFGVDPMKAKGMEGVSEFDAERVAIAVEKGEKLLAETTDAAKQIGDRALMRRVDAMVAAARDMFRAVEEDPRDLSSARKYMGVYLKGARDATVKFANHWSKTQDAEARSEYEALLADMEQSFDAHRETLMLENRTDLDVEIETLRDRLKQVGLKAKS